MSLLSSKGMLKNEKKLGTEILSVCHQQNGYSLHVILDKADS